MMKKIWGAIATTLGIALILLGIGALIGNSWAEDQVKQQLSQEKIFMPDDAGISKIKDEGCRNTLSEYKGQPLADGDQAKAYADCYIWQHMMASSDGKTYSEISTAGQKDKDNAKLAELKQSLFMGDSLRGMLLNAYAWWTLAKIAFWAGLGSLLLGLPLLIAGLLMMRRKHHDDHAVVTRRTTAPVTTERTVVKDTNDGHGASAV